MQIKNNKQMLALLNSSKLELLYELGLNEYYYSNDKDFIHEVLSTEHNEIRIITFFDEKRKIIAKFFEYKNENFLYVKEILNKNEQNDIFYLYRLSNLKDSHHMFRELLIAQF